MDDKIKREKTVLLPIKVPVGDHCWGPGPQHLICNHLSNEGGHPICGFDMDHLSYTPDGNVLKPFKCLTLMQRW